MSRTRRRAWTHEGFFAWGREKTCRPGCWVCDKGYGRRMNRRERRAARKRIEEERHD